MISKMIWVGSALVAFAASGAAEQGAFMLTPDIHGNSVAFTREGDIWIADLATGVANRLTRHDGIESKVRFSPDGSQIAFMGQYDGGFQVYVMPVTGGVPKRVTNHVTGTVLEDWTPDGTKLLCRGPVADNISQPFLVNANGGPEEPLPIQKIGMGQIGPNNQIVFCKNTDIAGGAWFRYHGGARNDIWLGDLTTKSFKKIYESKFQAQYPQWVGNRVYFVLENSASWTIASVNASGGDFKRHTAPSSEVIYELQTDGKRLVYVKGNGLELFDPAKNSAMPLKLELSGDRIHARPTKVDAAANATGYTITPSGKRILVETRGQILTVPVKEGEIRVWKSLPGVRLQLATMSPNGKHP